MTPDREALRAEVIRRYQAGEAGYEISNALGVPVGTMSDWLRDQPRRIKRRAWRFNRAEALAVLRDHGLGEASRRYGRRYARDLAIAEGLPVPLRRSGPPSVWQPGWDDQLGKVPDAVLAARLGVSSVVVTNRRQALGIGRTAIRDYRRGMIAALPDDELMRGTPADVAARVGQGVGGGLVCSERRARGLVGNTQPSPAVLQRAAVAGMLAVAAGRDGAQAAIGRVLKVSRERARQLCNEVRAVLMRGETEGGHAEGSGEAKPRTESP